VEKAKHCPAAHLKEDIGGITFIPTFLHIHINAGNVRLDDA
jgi:hypothetical protein